jgi:hypothetical protein
VLEKKLQTHGGKCVRISCTHKYRIQPAVVVENYYFYTTSQLPPKQFPRMTASQILVRRHRNRDGNEDAPAASSSSNGNVNDRGIDEDVPMTQNITVDSSNANDDSSPSATAGNVSSDESQNEEQELVVQVPNSWQQSSGGIPPSFVLPQMAWETNEEQTALRREAIHREVR